MDNPNEKFGLEREIKAPLTMFFFTVQDARIAVKVPMDVKAILAYDMTNAMTQLKTGYPAKMKIFVTQKGSITMKNVLNVVDMEPSVLKPEEKAKIKENIKTIILPPKQEMTKQEFVRNCLLIADTFVVNKRDKVSIKRILNKINLKKHVEKKA